MFGYGRRFPVAPHETCTSHCSLPQRDEHELS